VIIWLGNEFRSEAQSQASSPLRLGGGGRWIDPAIEVRRHDVDDGVGRAKANHIGARAAD